MDKNKLIQLLDDAFEKEYCKRGLITAYHTADYLIANGVTIPVRCKDCKHWLKDYPGCTDAIGRCEWANYMIGANGYCVYGERRTDGNTTNH